MEIAQEKAVSLYESLTNQPADLFEEPDQPADSYEVPADSKPADSLDSENQVRLVILARLIFNLPKQLLWSLGTVTSQQWHHFPFRFPPAKGARPKIKRADAVALWKAPSTKIMCTTLKWQQGLWMLCNRVLCVATNNYGENSSSFCRRRCEDT